MKKTMYSCYACHNVYHNGFEITFMQGKYILYAFCLIFLLIAPAAASLSKIAAGSPVFLGENAVDISAALKGCHTIAWWQNGTSMDASPSKNMTLYAIDSIAERNYFFNISPALFSNYTGMWYCEDMQPHTPVFDVRDPQIAITVWDLDQDQDVTGKTIPRATNITYRIDTNLYPALNYLNRPNSNPSDSFFTVKLTDPRGRNIANIYTGNYGGTNTLILPFDTTPYISSSPYLWRNGNTWDRAARNIQGDVIYPPGNYTFTVSQNLNHMQESYAAGGGNDMEGKMISSATVTFLASDSVTVPSSSVTTVSTLPQVIISSPATPVLTIATAVPITSPAKKTTYAPLPGWIALLGVGIAGVLAVVRRNN
jgi:hypothetical protein